MAFLKVTAGEDQIEKVMFEKNLEEAVLSNAA